MYPYLLAATALVCMAAFVYAYARYRDVFHPLIYAVPMFLFIYFYMPARLLQTGELYLYLTSDQLLFAHGVILATILAFVVGSLKGSKAASPQHRMRRILPDPVVLQRGAYFLGATGLLAWAITIQNVGGFRSAFGQAYGGGWSDYGYVRDAALLLFAALLLLLSPVGFNPNSLLWKFSVCMFAAPWLLQGLLGARRGPTFVVIAMLAMGWFVARGTRPRLSLFLVSGALLGVLLLFLVSHRSSIYLGGDLDMDLDSLGQIAAANEANEYIFGSGCIVTAHHTGQYFWGRRLLAYVLVRPVPRQIWPNKYSDFGVPEIEVNSGVAGGGIQGVMGWREIPGAAGTMAADLWVEFSWLAIPLAGAIGWVYGLAWRRAVLERGYWAIQYLNLATLSIYLITQGIEPILFRTLVLTIPTAFVWRLAEKRAMRCAGAGRHDLGPPFHPPRPPGFYQIHAHSEHHPMHKPWGDGAS